MKSEEIIQKIKTDEINPSKCSAVATHWNAPLAVDICGKRKVFGRWDFQIHPRGDDSVRIWVNESKLTNVILKKGEL